MSVQWYETALTEILQGAGGAIDLTGDIVVIGLEAGYTFSDSDEFISDLSGELSRSAPLTGVDFTAGELRGDDTVLSGVNNPDVVTALVVAVDTGSDATSHLLGYTNEKADSTPISITGDGTDIAIPWPDNLIGSI